MPSLSDLPDDLFFDIGTYLEHDLHTLTSFLLIHPRIYAACKDLRYRSRTFIFDGDEALQSYINNRSRLHTVSSVQLCGTYPNLPFLARANLKPAGRIGKTMENAEKYDEELATVVSLFRNIRQVCFYTPIAGSLGIAQQPGASLKRTLEALGRREEIEGVHIDGPLSLQKDLLPVLKLAEGLPNCHKLKITQSTSAQDVDMLLPIVRHLCLPAVAPRLASIELDRLQLSGLDYFTQVLHAISYLPTLPLLHTLSFQLATDPMKHPEGRRAAARIIAGILKKAAHVRTLKISGEVLSYLAQEDVPIPGRLNLTFANRNDTTVAWGGQYASVRTLTLEGAGAGRASGLVLTGSVAEASYPFPGLRHFTLIDSTGWGNAEQVNRRASTQLFTVDYIPSEAPVGEEDIFVNPVNPGIASRREQEFMLVKAATLLRDFRYHPV